MLFPRRLAALPPLLLGIILSHVSAESLFSTNPALESTVKSVLEYTPAPVPDDHCAKLRPTGPIETTDCDYEALDAVNEDLFSKLHQLVETPFFRYFKVDLYRDCPFWMDDGLCMQRECGVTSLDESEVPERWRAAELSRVHKETANEVRLPGCYSGDSDYCFLDDGDEGEYIDLIMNQEGYTGYAGPAAHRVWSAIYDDNCFGIQEDHAVHEDELSSRYAQSPTSAIGLTSDSREECLEKRVYYRVISGLHASISTHICHLYLDKSTGTWGPNLDCFTERIAEHPERLQYMYFNTVLLLRAVSRIEPFLSAYNLDSEHEPKTNALLTNVLDIAKSVGTFDETALFSGSDAKILKAEFKDRFRNVSRIMDCVGCDKCRLWGKVQVTGIATAMKILFEMDETALDPQLNQNFLSRWEIVALLNVLHRLSESLHATEEFRRLWMEKKAKETKSSSAASARQSMANSKGQGASTPLGRKPDITTGAPPQQQPLPPHSHPATSSPKTTSSTSGPLRTSFQIQDVGKTVYDLCKRSTVGCINVISGFAHTVLRRFGDWEGRENQPSSGDL